MKFAKASSRDPQMGLDGKICINPKYWCRRHEVWLSEDDVIRKECRCRLSYDMMSRTPCGNLEEKDFKEWAKRL